MTPKKTILNENTLSDHFVCYRNSPSDYVNTVVETLSQSLVAKAITLTNKSRILVTLIHHLDKAGFQKVLDFIDLPELVSACETLDSNRLVRQLEKKVKLATNEKKRRRLTMRMNDAKNLNQGVPELSLTLAKIKLIKLWVNNLTEEQLVYRALIFPTEKWRKLADLTHLNPSKDFKLAWFLPYCYGKDAPEGSIVNKIKNMNMSNFKELYEEYQMPYEFIRLKWKEWGNWNFATLEKIKLQIVNSEKLKTILWYWHELQTPNVNKAIAERLKNIETVDISYGKLMDLLMRCDDPDLTKQLVRITENQLQNYEMSLDSPIVVLGDASSSMQVAINTSSIITSLLSKLAKAEVRLFRNNDNPVAKVPSTIDEVLTFAKQMRAGGSTSPAASLYPYYATKQVVKTFIIVTDEEENTTHSGYVSWYNRSNSNNGMFFSELYEKYAIEVYPAKLIFVSFTQPNTDGFMVNELKKRIGESKFNEFVQVFKFNVNNPDLNKFDYVLEQMSTATSCELTNTVDSDYVIC